MIPYEGTIAGVSTPSGAGDGVDRSARNNVGAPQKVYRCAGLLVSSPLALAAPVVDGPADVELVEGEARAVPPERPSMEVIAERTADGATWYTFARREDKVVGRFYGAVDFEVDADRRRVTYHKDPSLDPELVAILVNGSLVAYLLAAGGRLVLHASAVEVDAAALAFLGPSGQGKTTVATLLCAAGYPLVSDDLLPVDPGPEEVTCVPGGVELRVREKVSQLVDRFPVGTSSRRTADERHALAPGLTLAERLPLRAVVVPLPDRNTDKVTARRLPPGEAVMLLARCQRIEGWVSPAALRAQFEAVVAVVESAPVLEMHVPWGPPFAEGIADELVAATGAFALR